MENEREIELIIRKFAKDCGDDYHNTGCEDEIVELLSLIKALLHQSDLSKMMGEYERGKAEERERILKEIGNLDTITTTLINKRFVRVDLDEVKAIINGREGL